MSYIVKNLKGTSDNIPQNADSWLDYWEQRTGLIAHCCHSVDCPIAGRNNLVGAHVQLCAPFNWNWYIVPLCHGCNHRNDDFTVEGPLVPVNKNLPILW